MTASEEPRVALVVEWLDSFRWESTIERIRSVVDLVVSTDGLPARPPDWPGDGPPFVVELEYRSSGLVENARLTLTDRELSAPLWSPQRLILSLDQRVAGALQQEAIRLMHQVGKALECTYAGIVTRHGPTLYPTTTLDLFGRPFFTWAMLLSRSQYSDPPMAESLGPMFNAFHMSCTWDFHNVVSFERYSEGADSWRQWCSESMPISLRKKLEAWGA